MATITKVFGWAEIALAAYAAYICAKGAVGIVASDASDMTLEWVPLVVAISLPISLSLAWSGWHLIKRQDWLQQSVPFFVILTVAILLFAMDY